MNSAKLLHFLVNDMLDLFQIRSGKFVRRDLKVNLKITQLVDLAQTFQIQVEDKSLSLDLSYHSLLPLELTLDI